MRACRHCSHHNADHLAYCSRCGKRLGPTTLGGSEIPNGAPTTMRVSGQVGMLAATAAMSPTVMATATPAPASATGAGLGSPKRSRLRWAAGSIGYIYVYSRGKMHAGERRRRLIDERDGAQALLGGTVRELGGLVLRERVQHPDLSGLLESITRAESKRKAAIEDTQASEKQKESEESHLLSQEAVEEAHWKAADLAAHDAEEMLAGVDAETDKTAGRLERVRNDRARLAREADAASEAADGKARAASLRHDEQGMGTEQAALEERLERLEREQAQLREKSAELRATATAARSKLEQAGAARRQVGAAMTATVAGHVRDRAEAERAITDLTEQLGRAAAHSRPVVEALLPAYQRIDRLQETIADRTIQIAELERANAHYDVRKLLTGVGLLTGMLAATAIVLWVVLK